MQLDSHLWTETFDFSNLEQHIQFLFPVEQATQILLHFTRVLFPELSDALLAQTMCKNEIEYLSYLTADMNLLGGDPIYENYTNLMRVIPAAGPCDMITLRTQIAAAVTDAAIRDPENVCHTVIKALHNSNSDQILTRENIREIIEPGNMTVDEYALISRDPKTAARWLQNLPNIHSLVCSHMGDAKTALKIIDFIARRDRMDKGMAYLCHLRLDDKPDDDPEANALYNALHIVRSKARN